MVDIKEGAALCVKYIEEPGYFVRTWKGIDPATFTYRTRKLLTTEPSTPVTNDGPISQGKALFSVCFCALNGEEVKGWSNEIGVIAS